MRNNIGHFQRRSLIFSLDLRSPMLPERETEEETGREGQIQPHNAPTGYKWFLSYLSYTFDDIRYCHRCSVYPRSEILQHDYPNTYNSSTTP